MCLYAALVIRPIQVMDCDTRMGGICSKKIAHIWAVFTRIERLTKYGSLGYILGPLTGAPQCHMLNLRNSNVPFHYS